MKVDKETLIKHRFWIGLGVFLLFWLILTIVLPFTIGSLAAAKRKEFTDAVKSVEGIKEPRKHFANPAWVAPLQSKEEILKGKKNEVWKASYEPQDGIMTWPSDPQNISPLNESLKNAYFGDPLSDRDRLRYAEELYNPTSGDSQFASFKYAIAPAYYQSGSYETAIRPVRDMKHPTSEECWLAQEDLWVKRELVNVIRTAMDTVGHFTKFEPQQKPALPPGAVGAQYFRNSNWELELIFEQNDKKQVTVSGKSKVKNINLSHRRLPLAGVLFRVQQFDANGVSKGIGDILVEGEPLNWGESVEVKKSPRIDSFDPQQPMEVDQIFSWFTSPIKRLDRIETGNKLALSHRFFKYPLQAKKIAGSPEDKPADTSTTAGPGGNNPMQGMMMSGASQMPGMGEGGGGLFGGTGSSTLTGNGLERNRYIDFSDQVRRMPVAMVLVVDQANVEDVFAALANSRMRMWLTQWEWQHIRGVQPPAMEEVAKDGSSGKPEVAEGAFGMGGGSGVTVMGYGPRPGMGSGPGINYGMSSGPPPGAGSGSGSGLGMMKPGMGSGGAAMGGLSTMRPGMGSGSGGGYSSTGYGGMPTFLQGTGQASGAYAAGQDDPNLVQLAVYAIASLYERYPPRETTPAAPGGAPTTTTTPAAPTAPGAASPGVVSPPGVASPVSPAKP
jgi:hypothetical protein